MPFNYNFESLPIDVSKTYGFEIIAFPSDKPKYESLGRRFKRANLVFSEDGHGGYYLETTSASLEARVNLSPNPWDGKAKKCEITFTCIGLDLKYNSRKELVEFGENISSLINWEHKIVWFTDNSALPFGKTVTKKRNQKKELPK
jgi:hypothetical protein